eukprot:3060321-Pleurochrysis_carterae.AAC.2
MVRRSSCSTPGRHPGFGPLQHQHQGMIRLQAIQLMLRQSSENVCATRWSSHPTTFHMVLWASNVVAGEPPKRVQSTCA